MFEDSYGTRFDIKKIVRIGPATEYSVGSGKPEASLEHEVWVDGVVEPFLVDAEAVESILEQRGTIIAAQPGFYVVDLRPDAEVPVTAPILAWLITEIAYRRPIPITINGLNNGISTDTINWILEPSGLVTTLDESFNSLTEYTLEMLRIRQND
ncbi:MAG: hypothetical protein ACKVOJ_08270 [Sphingomonadaceae bacterium]